MRTASQYCVRGERVGGGVSTMPRFEPATPKARVLHGVRREALRTDFPAATRWLAGYGSHSGGSLVAFDYADGALTYLLRMNTTLIAPVRTAPLGKQPEMLWVAASAGGLSSDTALHTILPDGADKPEWHTDLPAPLSSAYRLSDDSLLLHFHPTDAPFRTEVRDGVMVLGQSSYPPPLRLLPDGTLLPGCEGEELAGEAPPLFP